MRHIRAGLTLIEVLVVMAMIGVMFAIGAPAVSAVFDLEQRAAARELAETYTWLVAEASLRNVTFRVAYNLDRRTWKVEAGDPDTLVFSNPEERQANDDLVAERIDRFTRRELAEGAAAEIEEKRGRFEGLVDPAFTTEQKLPADTAFAFVYTPQYGDGGLTPHDEPPDDPEDDRIAYTYVFSDGTAEHIVVRLVDEDDADDGFTLEVEPLTGRVRLTDDLVDPEDSFSWLPDRGPELR